MPTIKPSHENLTMLFSEKQIQERVIELANEIENTVDPNLPIHLIGVLKGGFIFLADLARAFSRSVTIDFVGCSSYKNDTTPSKPNIYGRPDETLNGKYVLLVEDIVDTGETLNTLRELILKQRPKELHTVCLLDKKIRRKKFTNISYVGFSIENVFVVGYGLDYAQTYRNLPYIAALSTHESDTAPTIASTSSS